MDKTLCVVLLKTVGGGFSSLNLAGGIEDLEIIEFSPLGAQAQLIALGSPKAISRLVVELRTADIERTAILSNFDEKILRSYLGLETAPIKEFTLVVESHFVGELFHCAADLLTKKFEIVDFRLFRSTGSPGHIIFTGDDLARAEAWVAEKESQTKKGSFSVSLQYNLSAGFRQYLG